MLVSSCTIIKTIYSHHILTSISILFRQFVITIPDLQLQKITHNKLFSSAMLPQIHGTQGMVRNI